MPGREEAGWRGDKLGSSPGTALGATRKETSPLPVLLLGSPLVPANRNFSWCVIHPGLTHPARCAGNREKAGLKGAAWMEGRSQGLLKVRGSLAQFLPPPRLLP